MPDLTVVKPGVQTTVQDWPGRTGLWGVGVPPSGPMDTLAFRLANAIAGNEPAAAGLEALLGGPTLRFGRDAVVVVGGAPVRVRVDDRDAAMWSPLEVPAGATLKLGAVRGNGMRVVVAVRGGIDVPPVLGSRATFTLGALGGVAGRALAAGDVLAIGDALAGPPRRQGPGVVPATYGPEWTLRVLAGPHGAPEHFMDADLDALFGHAWEVHHHSARTGVRLVGPRPAWARADGGDAGLHPSNVHDNPYAVGSLIFTGDMPVIVGPDGPSLGGFTSPCCIVAADLWKLGQLRPGDVVRLEPIGAVDAAALAADHERVVAGQSAQAPFATGRPRSGEADRIVLGGSPAGAAVRSTYRRAGDRGILVEAGPSELDLAVRLRIHALQLALEELALDGVGELIPGIRTLRVELEPGADAGAILDALRELEMRLPDPEEIEVPSRVVRLPLSWDDDAIEAAIERYERSVRAGAPWWPSNIEFIRRINGLASVDAVRELIFDASYLVLGLGDVYLGAPVAVPVDPRHRLVTTKYDPARTWTPQNAVGIGGAYLCVYGIEGPGGYQLFGRTLPVWDVHRIAEGRPWLLRLFDQIRFEPVDHATLTALRAQAVAGRIELAAEPATFRLADERRLVEADPEGVRAFRERQQAAFAAEREAWALALGSGEPA